MYQLFDSHVMHLAAVSVFGVSLLGFTTSLIVRAEENALASDKLWYHLANRVRHQLKARSNVSRSTSFLQRYLYHHFWVKAKKSVHGISALLYLFSGFLSLGWMITTNEQSPRLVRELNLISAIVLYLGLFTKYFRKKRNKIGRLQAFQHQFGILLVACCAGANSSYSIGPPKSGDSMFYSAETLVNICTAMSLFLPVVSLLIYVYMFIQELEWIAPLSTIPYLTTFPFLYGPALYHYWHGTQALALLYGKYRIGECIVFLSTVAAIGTALDIASRNIVLKKGISLEQAEKFIGQYFWSTCGIVMFLATAWYCNIWFALANSLVTSLEIPLQLTLVSQKTFDKLARNRSKLGIIVRETVDRQYSDDLSVTS